jgi:hypothetical protein
MLIYTALNLEDKKFTGSLKAGTYIWSEIIITKNSNNGV